MPQEFQVLRCFNCNFFQVHIVKKKQQWQCKICNEKQSVIKVFMRSESGRDCREYVQELNLHCGTAPDTEEVTENNSQRELGHDEKTNIEFKPELKNDSVWNQFLNDPETEPNKEEISTNFHVNATKNMFENDFDDADLNI